MPRRCAAAQDADEPGGEEGAETESRAAPGASDERARAYFVLGRSAYDAGEYDEAIEQFGRAYELSQRPDLLFNLYQAHHRAGNLEPAVDYLERYLEEGSPGDLQRGTLTERLTNLRRQLVEEETRRLQAEAEAERERLGELERAREEATEAASNPVRTAGIVVLSIGGAAAAGFALFAGLALKEDNEVAGGADAGRTCLPSQLSRLQTLSRAADVSLGLASAAIVTGVIMIIVGKPSDDSSPETAVVPRVGPGYAGVGLERSF